MVIQVCVGSSCHLKGSYGVIEALQRVVEKYGVGAKVRLQASFCLGCCAQGATVACKPQGAEEEEASLFLHKATADNIEQLFVEQVLPLL